MAERRRGGGRGGARGGGRGGGRGEVPQPEEATRHRDLRDVENDELRQMVRDLQRRLAQLETPTGTNSDSDLSHPDDDDGENPFGGRAGERGGNGYYGVDPAPDIGMRIDIPEFEGKALPDEFIDWLNTVERVFDIKNISDSNKVKLVAIKLKKHASIWWEHVKKQRARERKSKIQSWEKMKKLLRGKFLPAHYRQDAFIDYHVCKQGDMSVEEFTNEFDHLRMRCDVEEEEEQTIARYFGALRTDIAEVIQLQQYFSYEDVCRLALKVEKQFKGKKVSSRWSGRESTNFRGSSNGSGSSQPATAPVATKQQVPTKPGQSVESGPRARQPVRCFKCQGLGHMQADCPNRVMVTFVGDDDAPLFDESENSESDADAELVYADRGPALVVRRVLNLSPAEDEQWLRHNIFHTKCTTKGKVCSLIIDGGSCENVVSATMVEKLGLKTVDHPHLTSFHGLLKDVS